MPEHGESVAPIDPNGTLVPHLWVESKTEVCCTYYGDFNDAVQGAHAAEILGLGYRLDAYVGQISDTEDQREWRLVVWKMLHADAIISPRKAELNDGPDERGTS